MFDNIAIIGSSGAIGSALLEHLSDTYPNATIYAFARKPNSDVDSSIQFFDINYDDEHSIESAAQIASEHQPLELVVVTTGILHEGNIQSEKSLKDLSADKLQRLFYVNTVVPTLIAKHFIPKLNKHKKAIFAALSARVGSISDNHLGGWYSYRASKAALNMIIKAASIEQKRLSKESIIIGLHPGTVDSPLSQPFQSRVTPEQLFTPHKSAKKLLDVLKTVTASDSGKCFAWDGQEILP